MTAVLRSITWRQGPADTASGTGTEEKESIAENMHKISAKGATVAKCDDERESRNKKGESEWRESQVFLCAQKEEKV